MRAIGEEIGDWGRRVELVWVQGLGAGGEGGSRTAVYREEVLYGALAIVGVWGWVCVGALGV